VRDPPENLMPIISTTRREDCVTEHTAETIRAVVARFAEQLSAAGVEFVRVWCSWNPDLPDDSPLQSPQETIPPCLVTTFLDAAVKNRVWTYADVWNRAGIDALDGSFKLLLGNDRDINLETQNHQLLDVTRSEWVRAGYEVYEGDGKTWVRINPASVSR
jgi:hypothetical protein